MKKLALVLGAAALSLGSAGTVLAADTGAMASTSSTSSAAVMGEHSMPATVTHVNHKTGLMHVTSEGMKLTVHFPPAALAKVKNGDKIDLHLGFSPG